MIENILGIYKKSTTTTLIYSMVCLFILWFAAFYLKKTLLM